MELLMMIAGGMLGVGFLVLNFKENNRMLQLADFLSALFMVLLFLITGVNDGREIAGVAVLSLALLFLLSKVELFRRSRFAQLVLIIPSLIFFLFGKAFTYGDYPVEPDSLNFHLLLAYGIVIPLALNLKSGLFSSLLGLKDDSLKIPFGLFVIGFSSFIGTFFLSWAGLFLIGLGVAFYSLFSSGKGRELMYSLFSIALTGFFIDFGGFEIVDLSMGKVLEGLFFGIFAVTIVGAVSQSTNRKVFWTIASLLLSLFMIAGVVLLGTQKSDLGGMDAFIGALIGVSIAFLFISRKALMGVFFGAMTFLGLFLFPFLNKPLQEDGVSNAPNIRGVETVVQPQEEVMIPVAADSLVGKYQLNKDGFKFDFELGPKGGRTKGGFKDISGEINISELVETSFINVELPISGLTTFNSFRDESLMEAEYFNAAKFSSVKYTSRSMQRKNDFYILNGKFTMLGVSKDQEVIVRFTKDKDGKRYILGEGSVDRTLFGMRPDPKEGNVVDFEFKIELKK